MKDQEAQSPVPIDGLDLGSVMPDVPPTLQAALERQYSGDAEREAASFGSFMDTAL